MKPLALILSAACLWAALGVSEASAASLSGGTQPYQRWADAALVPTADGPITVIEQTNVEAVCGTARRACTDGQTVWIVSWLSHIRPVFLHEMGHIYALQHPELADFDDEQFADAYSLCALRWHFIAKGRRYLNFRCARLRAWSGSN